MELVPSRFSKNHRRSLASLRMNGRAPRFPSLCLLRRFHANKHLIPAVVLTRQHLSVSAETSIKHFAVFHIRYIDQSPSRDTAAASSSHLPAEQAYYPILNAVVMGLCDALVTVVLEPDQLLILNCSMKQVIQFWIDSHSIHFIISPRRTSSAAAESAMYLPARIQTSAHPHPARNMLSSS
jgi:hypothetical protein